MNAFLSTLVPANVIPSALIPSALIPSALIPSTVRSRRGRHRRALSSAPLPDPQCTSPRLTGAQLHIAITGTALTLIGELDLSTRDLLERAGQELARATHACGTDVVVDAAGLSFVDAAGLGALVSLSDLLAAAGIHLCIPYASPQLRRISALCELDEKLRLVPLPRPHEWRAGGDRAISGQGRQPDHSEWQALPFQDEASG